MSRRLPPPEDALLSTAFLIEENLRLDEPIRMNYHTSNKGYTAVRLNSKSWGRDWFVDFYNGPWFFISVTGFEPVCENNLYSMITTLNALLRGINETI